MNACTNNCKKENLEILLSADADVNMKAHVWILFVLFYFLSIDL